MTLENQPSLSVEEAKRATKNERLASISKFLESRAKHFHRTLKPREKANFDEEDIALELWLAVAERDHKWVPESGKYITFAGAIVTRALSDLRDRARTVESPRNSSCRMKEYAAEEDALGISGERSKTANDIRRTKEGIGGLSSYGPSNIPVYDQCHASDTSEAALAATKLVRKGIATQLTIFEAQVVGLAYSLWERCPLGESTDSLGVISWRLHSEPALVKRAKDVAINKLRTFIEESGAAWLADSEKTSCPVNELDEKDQYDAEDHRF